MYKDFEKEDPRIKDGNDEKEKPPLEKSLNDVIQYIDL
jgi:hypothetical protein